MLAAALALWAGVPSGCLVVGSQVQGATGSVGLALLGMAVSGAIAIFALIRLLTSLNAQYSHARERRGLESYGNVALEGVMAISAFVALVSFCVWFFLFSGSSPIPLNIGY